MSNDSYILLHRLGHAIDQINEDRSDIQSTGILDQVFTIIFDFDVIVGQLYTIRTTLPASDPVRQQLEDGVATLSRDLIFLGHRGKKEGIYRGWISKYRRIWRQELALFFFCLFLFIASIVIGWNIAISQPDFVPLLMPQGLMERIIDQKAWFDAAHINPYLDGTAIAYNNIRVSITCFAMSAVFGIGGLVIMCLNGIFFGSVMGYCYIHGFHDRLGDFVVSHGPLELTIIVASAFAGMLFGRAFFMRPYNRFTTHIYKGAQQAALVLVGILPWLVLAAAFEVLVSPYHYLSFQAKLTAGVIIAIAFWLWTFGPVSEDS